MATTDVTQALRPVEMVGHDTTALMIRDGGLPSLERMRERMQYQKEMRAMLVEYVKSEMDPERHFYTIPGSTKPALSQDGARMLCTLYEVHAEDTLFDESFEEDGHYTVKATVRLRSMATGQMVAEGTGRCSTHESKYAYRWMWDNEIPGSVRKADCEKRQRGKSWQYKMPNLDLADTYNTVLKIAEKRGQTAAVLRLPCAPDVFSESGSEEEDREKEDAADRKELIGLIVKWAKTLPAGTRSRAFEVLWGTPYEQISRLSLTALDTGYGLAEQTTAAQIDWKSKTLKEDVAKLQTASAEQAKTHLYGDPLPNPTAHMSRTVTTPPRDVDPETGEILERRLPLPATQQSDTMTLIAQIEAVIAAQHGDLEQWYVWAERRFKKSRVAFTGDDYAAFLSQLRTMAAGQASQEQRHNAPEGTKETQSPHGEVGTQPGDDGTQGASWGPGSPDLMAQEEMAETVATEEGAHHA